MKQVHPTSRSAGQGGFAWSTAVLAVVVSAAAALAVWRPWAGHAPDEARLRARVEEYVQARKTSQWQGLYAMTNPADRARVPFEQFLLFYGSKAIVMHGATVRAVRIDGAARTATTELLADIQLNPDHLPAQFRRGLNVQDQSSLRQHSELSLDWVFADGDWFFGMDRAVTTGRDAQGRQVGAAAPANTGKPK